MCVVFVCMVCVVCVCGVVCGYVCGVCVVCVCVWCVWGVWVCVGCVGVCVGVSVVCGYVWCVGMCVVCGYVVCGHVCIFATCPHHFLQPFIENVIGTVTLSHLLGQVFPLLLLLFQLLHQQPQLPLHLFLLQKELFQALLPLFPVHLNVALVLAKTEILRL